jgi:TRAP-type C4-dicarboxylate transport system permease large subunit
MAMMVLTIPVVIPIAVALDWDLIWFGIIMIKLLEIGLVTPPVGLNVYVMKSSLGNTIPLTTMFKGTFWFLGMDFLTLFFLIAFPGLTLWLPTIMN